MKDLPGCCQEGRIRTVHNSLGADIKPASGGKLTIIGDSKGSAAIPLFQIIIFTYHETIGKNDPGAGAG